MYFFEFNFDSYLIFFRVSIIKGNTIVNTHVYTNEQVYLIDVIILTFGFFIYRDDYFQLNTLSFIIQFFCQLINLPILVMRLFYKRQISYGLQK